MSTVLGQGKFLRLVRDGSWEFVERVNARGVVAIVAVTADRRIILTDQFRPAVGRRVIVLPAGLAGDVQGQEDEAFAESAMRELIEETGYSANQLEHVADFPSSPGMTSEVVSLFVARDLLKRTPAAASTVKTLRSIHQRFAESTAGWQPRSAAGKLIDGKVYAGLYFAKRRGAKRHGKAKTRSQEAEHFSCDHANQVSAFYCVRCERSFLPSNF